MIFTPIARLLDRLRRPPDADPRKVLGRRGEELAARHLRRRGMRVLARNWTCPAGEIDLICRDGRAVVYVEVKTRATGTSDPEDKVNPAKQRQVKRLAAIHARRFAQEPLIRFDVVAVVLLPGKAPVIRHLVDAFA